MKFCNLRIAVVMGVLLAFPSVVLADDAMKCVQSQLNELGYDAGAPDGQLGKRTKLAGLKYIEFMKANNPGWNMPPIDASNARLWCEKVAEAWPNVSEQWRSLNATPLPSTDGTDAAGTEGVGGDFIMTVAIDKGANFGVAVLKEGKVVWQSEDFGRDKGNWAVPVPKSALQQADQVCYFLEAGWVVLDQAGKPFQVSCEPITEQVRPMIMTGSGSTYTMAIQKAAP